MSIRFRKLVYSLYTFNLARDNYYLFIVVNTFPELASFFILKFPIRAAIPLEELLSFYLTVNPDAISGHDPKMWKLNPEFPRTS